MSEQRELPSIEERRAFVQKLAEFRATLPPYHQRMLDTMAIAAFTPIEHADVEGYEWFYSGPQYVSPTSSPNPWWYNGSGVAAWNQTAWGTTIGGIQTIYRPR